MDSNQRGRTLDVTHYQSDSGFLASFAGRLKMAFEAVYAELSPDCGEVRVGYLLDGNRWTHTLIIAVSIGEADRISTSRAVAGKSRG